MIEIKQNKEQTMTTAVFEEKNIQKAILTLGLPSMLGQLATLIYNLVDTYFVSLTNSPAQIAAVTLSLRYTCDYLRWIFLGAPFIILSNTFVHLFRSTGLIKEATISVMRGTGINIVLDWLFIVRLGNGSISSNILNIVLL